jgi:peptidoglycan/xylan/chitin deacetylase (PgdA/CDA1 family)
MKFNAGTWPERYTAAISITLDNMGEAAELHRGPWPENQPIGQHYSVTESLPPMLDLFDEYSVRATYFIEGWNTSVYPDILRELAQRGHEIAFHGWQHENWSELDAGGEEASMARNVDAFASIGVELRGFRPPGGLLTSASLELLRAYGIDYCSPAGERPAIADDTVVLPFEWRGIDAYYYSEGFASLREVKGDTSEPLTPGYLIDEISALVDRTKRTGGYTALLFHPFLENTPARFDAMARIIEMVVQDSDIWCAPCRDIAEWVSAKRASFPNDPGLDLTSWARRS